MSTIRLIDIANTHDEETLLVIPRDLRTKQYLSDEVEAKARRKRPQRLKAQRLQFQKEPLHLVGVCLFPNGEHPLLGNVNKKVQTCYDAAQAQEEREKEGKGKS